VAGIVFFVDFYLFVFQAAYRASEGSPMRTSTPVTRLFYLISGLLLAISLTGCG
jgi:hypothetical protein